ncbi:MAG: NAD(P)-dependent glycerol-3-phosphate dehydrogenase [Candidatus Cloacimonetes bacterium]|nr:NAD(P)-dependent glycerol-3-phosphate dehydrogenase [Candidatus Cloacimonadota bacterium]
MANISIIGGGSWGQAMALLLHRNTHKVKVWEYNEANATQLQNERRNDAFLQGIVFPPEIYFTHKMTELFTEPPQIIIYAVPSSFIRKTVQQSRPYIERAFPEKQGKKSALTAIINLAKGLEENTLKRMSEVIREELPAAFGDKICTLSGPSHAEEVARGVPTVVVVAGDNKDTLYEVRKEFSNAVFRVYSTFDLVGVEIGAAVKNIIALAAGVVDGLGFGDNTKGALLTRGLAEIKRLGMAMHADIETFSGLSGLGDLVTTAISQHSRNRYVGYQLGKGEKLEDILSKMVMVAEGVITTKNIRELKEKLQISMPITEEMFQLLFEGKDPKEAIFALMTRSLKNEAD